ncbi:hypothetical protein IWQ60_011866, partial [Tieghemiomyces parasiticus]
HAKEKVMTVLAEEVDLTGGSEQGSIHRTLYDLPITSAADLTIDSAARRLIYERCAERLEAMLQTLERNFGATSTQRAEAPTLGESIESKLVAYRRDRKRLQEARCALLDEHFEYFEVLREVLTELWTAATRYILNHEVAKVEAFTGYFHCVIENMYLKLRITHLDTRLRWLTPNVEEALAQLRRGFDNEEAQLAARLTEVGEHLLKYQRAGPEYEALAAAFREIVQATQQVQDDIQRIQA